MGCGKVASGCGGSPTALAQAIKNWSEEILELAWFFCIEADQLAEDGVELFRRGISGRAVALQLIIEPALEIKAVAVSIAIEPTEEARVENMDLQELAWVDFVKS